MLDFVEIHFRNIQGFPFIVDGRPDGHGEGLHEVDSNLGREERHGGLLRPHQPGNYYSTDIYTF